jgi:hypothetical protein
VTNIIQFPNKNLNRENITLTVETIKSNLDDVKLFHINETISAIIPGLLQQMALAGFDVTDDESKVSIKDGAFLVEAMKSMLCRHHNIKHPFQKIAEEIFINQHEDGSLEMAEKLSLNLIIDNLVEE